MQESKEVTKAKIANEEYLLKARQENDLMYKKRHALDFDMEIIRLECRIETDHLYATTSIIKEYGPESSMLTLIDKMRDKGLETLAKHKKGSE
jgi:hypothetical protein